MGITSRDDGSTGDTGLDLCFLTLSATDPRFPKYPGLPAFVCSGYQPTGLVDKNVSGAEQPCKRSEGSDDAPEHTGALFLDCHFKRSDCSLPLRRG